MNKVGGQSDIERVRDATDLVKLIGEHVVLKPRGREHVGLCPFHDDRSPSMAVVTHKGNAFYKCHACGAGGDAFDFVQNYHKMDFAEALRHLAQKAGVTLTPWKREDGDESTAGPRRIDVKKANAFATTYFRRTLSDETLGAAAQAVIASRGISPEMVEAFLIGAAPDGWDGLLNRIRKQNLPIEPFVSAGLLKPRKEGEGQYDAFRNRVMFPICDELGNPIAFGARKIKPEDEPKYLNSSESAIFSKSRTLYGLHLAKRSIIEKHVAIITEGYTDVIACHQAGITNVVATLGTAMTAEHASRLSHFCDSVVLLFDGDEAGMKAADRALAVSFRANLDIKVCVLPEGLDPDEMLKQAGGKERFESCIAAATEIFEYIFSRLRRSMEGLSLAGKQRLVETKMLELVDMGFDGLSGLRQQLLLGRIDDVLRMPVGSAKAALDQSSARKRRSTVAPSNTTTQNRHPSEPEREQAQDQDMVSRARRMAEFDLLGLVVFEPALSLSIIEDVAESIGGARGALAADRFRHPAAAAVARFVQSRLDNDARFTVQQMLSGLNDDEHRTVASRLYFDGQRLAGDDAANLETAVRGALFALDRCICRETLDETVADGSPAENDVTADPLSRLRSVISKKKAIGMDAAAIGRGVRA